MENLNKIIGDVNKFAVELKVEDWELLQGFCRIWIEGKSLGDFESRELLYPLVNSLHVDRKWLENKSITEVHSEIKIDKEYMFNILTNFPLFENEYEKIVTCNFSLAKCFSRMCFSASENFDLFIVRRFVQSNNLIFIWKERQVAWKEEYDPEVKMASVDIETFFNTTIELEKLTNFKPQPHFLD
jgi:hypothetical protein